MEGLCTYKKEEAACVKFFNGALQWASGQGNEALSYIGLRRIPSRAERRAASGFMDDNNSVV